MESGPIIRIDRATVAFGKKLALSEVTFDLAGPTSVALVGPNGSGKTTMLRLMAGLITPTAGSIEVQSKTPVAFVVQKHAASPWMPLTVGEIVEMGRFGGKGLVGRLEREDHDAIRDATERTEIGDLAGLQFGELSGGQQQRVLMARALAQRSELLLLDEPITGLDLASQERILEIVDDEVERGSLVVLSTHHLDEARRCERVALLNTQLVVEGSPTEVLVAKHLRTAYGGRVIEADGGSALVLDDHGHDH